MGQQQGSSLQDMLANYTTPIPNIAQKYEQNISKGGFLDMPGFNEMFNSYKAVGEREAGRQSAAINESFGSQGARYGSDLLAAQGGVRRDLFEQLMNKASEYQLGLRQQQSAEVAQLAGLQFGANEAGMNRLWADFLRRSSPPPGTQSAGQMSQGYGLPPSVV